jgi:hypothetical protein
MVKNHPAKWGKNNKLVNPLCLCVLPEMNSSNYPESNSLLTNDSQPEGLAPPLSPSYPPDRMSPHLQVPPFLDLNQEELAHPIDFDLHLSGWTEVFNRALNHPQLAYCVQVKCRVRGEIQHWTTFRTQRDFDDLFAMMPQSSKPLAPHHHGLESHGIDLSSPAPVAEVRDGAGAGAGGSPVTVPKKIELPKLNTNFSTVSARHQCSPDQSVHLMSLRLKLLLGDQIFPLLEKMADQSTEGIAAAAATATSQPNSSPRSFSAIDDSTQTSSEISLNPREAMFEENEDCPQVPISEMATTRAIFLNSLSKRSLLDLWFLQSPQPSDGGIEKYISPVVLRRAIQTAIVARALWDTHWREEIAVLYPTHVAFYSPMAKKASWTLSLQELIGISHIPDDKSPIVGKSVLKIETIGRVYYLAFPTKESCHSLSASILEHFSGITFENSLPSFVDTADPRDRFVLKSGRWRPAGRRLILNARKFSFDLESSAGGDHEGETYWEFSARLLRTVFQLDRNNSIHLSSDSLKSEHTTSRVTEIDHIDVSFETDADGLFPGRYPSLTLLLPSPICLCLQREDHLVPGRDCQVEVNQSAR